MKILYIAFGCSTKEGGEVKIGWSIPYEVSKDNEVYVITRNIYKDEHKNNKHLLKEHNIHFYYTDVDKSMANVFKGQLLPILLKSWNRRAYKLAQQICETYSIDIIHQITPIEIRSIGDFGKIKGPKFVVGPLGGGEYMPKALESYIPSFKIRLFEIGRKMANLLAKWKLKRKSRNIDYALFANRETLNYLKDIKFKHFEILSDIGIEELQIIEPQKKHSNDNVIFLTAGRLAYRKGHLLLLDAISQLEDKNNSHFVIVGDGPMKEMLIAKSKKLELGRIVTFIGNVPYTDMVEYYEKADAFIMPSLRETGGTVLLEALSNGLPVIAPNAFGGKNILDDETGYLYDISGDRQKIIDNLKSAIIQAKEDILTDKKISNKCIRKAKNYTWNKKCSEYVSLYKNIIENNK